MIPKVSKMDYVLAFWIMYGFPSLAIIVLSMIISIQNFNTNCGGSLISLPIWLIINSCSIISFLIGTMINLLSDSTIVFSITLFFDLVFKIIWTIVGTVALFRDSMACYTNVHYLWTMTLFAIIVSSMIIVTISLNISYNIFNISFDYNPIPNQDKNIQEI